MRIGRTHWALALSGAVLVHAGAAVAILWQPAESGTVSAGIGGIEVSLGPAGGAPGSVAATAAETPETETVTPPEEATPVAAPELADATEVDEAQTTISPDVAPAVDAPVEIEPIETVEATAVAATEIPIADVPVEAAEIAFQPETAPPAAVETAIIAAAEIMPVEDVPAPPTPQSKPRRPEPQRAPPPPDTAAETPEPEIATEPQPETVQAIAAIAPSAPGAGGKAGTQASPNAGSADDTTGGGMPGQTADFMAQLQAWLEKHKEYPRRARMRRQQGTALLYFVMDRDGQVLQHRLEQSSGHDLLDREVIAMIERAQPLPKLPETIDERRLELVVPVQFFLR